MPPADDFANGFSIIEGPVWVSGTLFVSQFGSTSRPPTSRLLSIVPGMGAVVANADFGSNGMAVDAQGNLIVAVAQGRLDPARAAADAVDLDGHRLAVHGQALQRAERRHHPR